MRRKCYTCEKVKTVRYRYDYDSGSRYYCSAECAVSGQGSRKIETAKCAVCGNEVLCNGYDTAFKQDAFCSLECAIKGLGIKEVDHKEKEHGT